MEWALQLCSSEIVIAKKQSEKRTHGMGLPRFLGNLFKEDGYEIFEMKEWIQDGRVEVHLGRRADRPWICHHCKGPLGAERGKHRLRLEGMPILGMRFYVHLWRFKGECKECKKARSEDIPFIAEETPHLTKDYAWWVGRLCEIAAVSRVAELLGQDETTTWRMDLARMQKMLERYKIPKVMRLSVDEVYARKKARTPEESRNQRFFTVITDLDKRKVIWVTEGRDESSLSLFFEIIGKSACSKIEVVAADQHEAYAKAVHKHCPNATLVWDRFHVMQNFEKVLNEERKRIHSEFEKNTKMSELTRGRHRFIFLKKACRRTEEETRHIDQVVKDNDLLLKLELIKERMLSFFDQVDEYQGRLAFHDVGEWIFQGDFPELKKWYWRLDSQWNQLANYFKYRVTSAVSEGINNVIKSLKRRAFGYRNMTYFKLKIMQVCGYLNSRYITSEDSLSCT
jgi:transposase